MKKNIHEYAAYIRNKFPRSYDNLSDSELVELWIKKYPSEISNIDFNNNPSSPTETVNHSDRLGALGKIGSFLIPLIGLFIYLFNKETKPKRAKSAAKSALWGLGISLILTIFTLGGGMMILYAFTQNQDYSQGTERFDSDNNNPELIENSTPIASSDANYSVENETNTKEYTCRECHKPIDWSGSYYWNVIPDGNYGVTHQIDTVPEKDEYAERYSTDEFFYEGVFTSGLFCSDECARSNLSRFRYPEDMLKEYTENYFQNN